MDSKVHRVGEQTYGYQWGRTGEGQSGSGMDMYTQLYLKRITDEDLLHSTGKAAQCYPSLDRRAVYANGYIVCTAKPLCCPPETMTTLSLNLFT